MRIDSHQHFWQLATRHGHWPPPALAAIHRDFMPADLSPSLDAAGIDGTVLVQSIPDAADTRFLLDLARSNRFVLGVVGWTDLKSIDAAADIAALARHPALRGLRPMLQDLDDPDWIADPRLDPAIRAMEEHGLRFDALVRTEHLAPLLEFVRRHPTLPVIIDHGAKPDIAGGISPRWRDGLAALADRPSVSVKLSGLLTQAGPEGAAEAVAPVVGELLAWFGPERVIWGSDWPVLRLADDYGEWLSLCRSLVPETHHASVFGWNACRFYGLDTPASPSPAGGGM